ncbi:hypothetical protein BJ166DRAFT_336451 [Pestalotiopsis sp. NC0098]|nr:hypothetical protein BJ166DRAFT_336451 [Pestalotiopsis sp. NC0098]
MGDQLQKHDAEHCSFRNGGVDDCSRAHLLLMITDYYFIERRADPEGDCRCPFLRCKQTFASAIEMVKHVKICGAFRGSEWWCPGCGELDSYHVGKSGNCALKMHGFAKKVLKPIKSISEHMGCKPSGRRSPSPVSSSSASSPVSISINTKAREMVQARTIEFSANSPTELASQEVSSPATSELDTDPLIKTYPVEMATTLLRSRNALPGYAIPEVTHFDPPRQADQSWSSNAFSSMVESSKSMDTPAAVFFPLPSRQTPSAWSTRTSSYDTQPSSRTYSTIDTHHPFVSPSSTTYEMQGSLAAAEPRIPSDPMYDNTFTDSPIAEDFGEDMLASLLPRVGNNVIPQEASITDPDVAVQPSIHTASVPISSRWLSDVYTPGLALSFSATKPHQTTLPQRYTSNDLKHAQRRTTSSSSGSCSFSTDEVMSDSLEMLVADAHRSLDHNGSSMALQISPPASVTGNEVMVNCEHTGCKYTYAESESHNYAKHLSRNHKDEIRYYCRFPGCDKSFKNRKDNLRKHQVSANHETFADQVLGVKGDCGINNRKLHRSAAKRIASTSLTRSRTGPQVPR